LVSVTRETPTKRATTPKTQELKEGALLKEISKRKKSSA